MNKQLSSYDWIQHGFHVLRTEGFVGLKADRMVKDLNVSRGSFYWHFKSLKDFHDALLTAWRNDITEAVIAELRSIPKGKDQLFMLITQVIAAPQELEASVRSWARSDSNVAVAVKQVDQLRIDFLTEVFVKNGTALQAARARAAILTWAYVGRTFAPEFTKHLDEKSIRDLAEVLVGASTTNPTETEK
ncbi:TetR/AcrR family transcriptional regulator [Aliiroseovarius sp. 2305UL8-7]|uniref:TetR/AcrR family transcriptional regulator n=1 Tax=Aliiroseovarius conchicola TaxID=3121637 RepID=UPI003527F381